MTETIVTHKTYQERVYLSSAGYGCIREVLGACRWLYNRFLEERRNTYRACGKGISKFAQMKQLTRLRAKSQWWRELSVQIARGVLVRVERSFQSFFRRVKAGDKPGYPRFRSSGRYRCIELAEVTPAMVKGNRICVKGLQSMWIRPSRKLPDGGQLKALRFVMRGRHLWADLVYREQVVPLPQNDSIVGVDLGVNQRMTLSSGEVVERRIVDRRRERRLQRAVSRCQMGSNGRRKAVAAFATEKRRNAMRNRGVCHVITTDLVRRYGTVVMEDLKVRSMTAAGGVHKRGLNREVLAQTWGMIRQQLAYKAEWAGRKLVEVNPAYTSRTCAACGVVNAKAKAYRVFECTGCGHVADRDVNAARNIMARGAFAPVA
ncbi:MAG: transposase [Caldilineaceae bacterium]|nr:transposase [Caldilineaceae bacterium]